MHHTSDAIGFKALVRNELTSFFEYHFGDWEPTLFIGTKNLECPLYFLAGIALFDTCLVTQRNACTSLYYDKSCTLCCIIDVNMYLDLSCTIYTNTMSTIDCSHGLMHAISDGALPNNEARIT